MRAGAHRAAGQPRNLPTRGTWLLAVASCLLLLLAAAQGYVSFRAQYTFIDHAKHARVPSTLEALGLDTGAVIFALLALSLARRGRRAAVERVLNVACAIGSLTMNLLAANLDSPRSITVWVMPSALYALASDRLIAVVRRWVLSTEPGDGGKEQGSPWQAFGGVVLWLLRLVLDVPGTVAGFRRWVLVAAPVAPGMRATLPVPGGRLALPAGDQAAQADAGTDHDPERTDTGPVSQQQPGTPDDQPADDQPADDQPADKARAHSELAPGETKRDALIRLYERCGEAGDPRYGDRAKSAQLAGEIAGRIGYHPGTARRELTKYLNGRAAAVHALEGPGTDAEEVA
jgi:hypothetical protein